MAVVYFAEGVTEIVGGLVERARPRVARVKAAVRKIGVVVGDAPRDLWIGLDFIKIPARDVESRFVDDAGGYRPSPHERGGFVVPGGSEKIVLACTTAPVAGYECIGYWRVVHAERDQGFLSELIIREGVVVWLLRVAVHLTCDLPG